MKNMLSNWIKFPLFFALVTFALWSVVEGSRTWFPPTSPDAPVEARVIFSDGESLDLTYILTSTIEVRNFRGRIIIPMTAIKAIYFKGCYRERQIQEHKDRLSELEGLELIKEGLRGPGPLIQDYILLLSGPEIEGIVLNEYIEAWDRDGLHHKILTSALISLKWVRE